MSEKSDYTAAEWDLLQGAMLESGAVMMALQPGGMVRESLAIFKTLDEAAEEYADNPLIVDLLDLVEAVPATPEEETGSDLPETVADLDANRQAMLEQLRQAVEVLRAKGTPREVEAYREVVVQVAVKTAAATKSGGFLGIGGQRVNQEELQLIGEIKDALGFVD